jgi:cellulose synthase/poly-beta-1,6-N-acetylglucosamine synthase-like glycosyltransferase
LQPLDLLFLIVLIALALPAGVACLYLLVQTLMSGELPAVARSSRQLRFDVVVPAHNESAAIAKTISNLRQLDWPAEQYRIVVVADNCTDATATIARAAGVTALERHDTTRRGKGYALLYAFEQGIKDAWADAVVVVDADAEASRNLLEAFAARLENGAQAVQAHYGVTDPSGSWRTRLLAIAMAAYHIVRSRARERQAVSCGIRGNGWCVTYALLKTTAYNAFSLTEDIEYGVQLGLAGFRVHYAGEAEAAQEMTANAKVASKQRHRWEYGRLLLVRTYTLALIQAALRKRSAVCLDLALDLIVLPITYVALNVAVLLAIALLASWHDRDFMPWLLLSLGYAGILVLYVMRGWSLSGTGVRGLLDLLGAPIFIVWKLLLMLGGQKNREWVRTERKQS